MIVHDLTTREVSVAIELSLRENGWTVTDCCDAYNLDRNDGRPLRKDFVHRVRKNQFSVITPRVLALCEFLKIDTNKKSFNYKLQNEMHAVERVIQSNPALEGKVKNLLRDIVEIAETQS